MAILKVAVLGNPVLRVPAEPVKNIQAPDIQRLIDDMIETMREYRGVGLAAPQVHSSLQIAVIEAEEDRNAREGSSRPLTVLVNPRIVPLTEQMVEGWEGCLSLPDLHGKVPRYTEINVQAHDRRGRPVHLSVSDFFARAIQHECDHLNGIVFLDRMKSFDTLAYPSEYTRYWARDEDEG
jgi:peptide deformylase